MRSVLLIITCLLAWCSEVMSVSDLNKFLKAMEKANLGEKSGAHQNLRQQLLAKARPIPKGVRALEEAYNDDAYGDDQVADGDDQVAAGDDAVANDDQANQYSNGGSYVNEDGLDLATYSLKYVGCQAVNTWSDSLAQDEDATVFALERFVVLRLCPTDRCSKYRKYGCGSNYGDYMLLMEDYLSIMKQYHYAQYQTFCNTCTQCMGGNENVAYQAAEGGGTRRRRLADDDAVNNDDQYQQQQGDDAAGDDNVNDDAAGDDQYQQQGDDYNQDLTYCPYEEECANYEQECQNHHYHGADYEIFMECTAFQTDDDQVVYLGPHCGSDGHRITIGFFDDEYCSKYIGNVGSYQDLQGYNINEDSMKFYYDSSCISCLDNDISWTLEDNDTSEGTYELCEVMYDTGAKCNKYLSSDAEYESSNQKENEDQVCAFIESLADNNYDESGEIKATADKYGWYTYQHYGMSAWQASCLAISIALFVGVLMYAVYLRQALVHRKPWNKPILDKSSPEYSAGRLSRVNSEILTSRSPTSWDGNEHEDTISTLSGISGTVSGSQRSGKCGFL